MILAIVQARMGSSRLPGKVLKEVNGKPLIEILLYRLSQSKKIDKIIIATSKNKENDSLAKTVKKLGFDVFRGSEDDLLDRYYQAAKRYNPKAVMRITGDCPLIDPDIIDKVVRKFEEDNVDYCANSVPPETSKFPDGSDVEVFSMKVLDQANLEVKDEHSREHVTFQFWQDSKYKSSQLIQNKDWSSYRITVDYPEDFKVVKYIFRELKRQNIFGYIDEIIDIVNSNENIKNKNSQYYFGQGWKK